VEHTIQFGSRPESAIVVTSGRADLAGFQRLHQDVVADPRYRRGMPLLVDHAGLELSALTPEEVRDVGLALADVAGQLGPSTMAVVVADATAWGLVRTIESHADQPQLHTRVFYGRREAVEWLRAQSAPPPAVSRR
jgi:hypothetical protein